jgi:purine-binding chemotaxis protein CheW
MTTSLTEPAGNALAAHAGKYLSFTLGAEFYGLPVLKVREIIRLARITPIPQMPEYIRGVINLRGKIVPVVDLRLRFGLGDPSATERTCIIVVQVERVGGGQMHMGLIVDGVDEVFNIAVGDIEETPEFGSKLDTTYLLGIAKVRERVTALLDIDRVITTEALARISRPGAEAAGATDLK